MLVISETLTTGQVTLIFRLVVQILSYGGLFILGLLALGNTPRVAPLETHDVLNRMVGGSTATLASIKWMAERVQGNDKDTRPPSRLFLALLLSFSFTLFVSLSDIGFVGIYKCSIPRASMLDFPASIKTDDDALNLIRANLINGTDPSSVYSRRCDAAESHSFSANVTVLNCTSWHNATYADAAAFRGLNSTDSDVLMPLQLARWKHLESDTFDVNMYYLGVGSQRVHRPVISSGIAIVPHDEGLQVVVGVPQLSRQRRVTIPRTLALEVDVGCMDLGINGVSFPGIKSGGPVSRDIYVASMDNMRKYTGPKYLSAVLSQTVDNIREEVFPIFNVSNKNVDGDLISYNRSWSTFSFRANIKTFYLPSLDGELSLRIPETRYILGNCTQQLNQQLGLPLNNTKTSAHSCGLLQVGGSFAQNGTLVEGISRMVCATATQVNMVSAAVEVDLAEHVTINLTRLPSDLHFIEADYWRALRDELDPGNINIVASGQVQRFTLSDNTRGPLNHFIFQHSPETLIPSLGSISRGVGSIGPVFSSTGSQMLQTTDAGEVLTALDDNYYQANLSTSKATKWAGEVGGSYVLASVGYNGWASLNSPPLTVVSTGGQTATCFRPAYGAAFLPLFVAALVAICWGVFMLLSSMFSGVKLLERFYGGMTPYANSVALEVLPQDTLLVWGSQPHLHLDIVADGNDDIPRSTVPSMGHS